MANNIKTFFSKVSKMNKRILNDANEVVIDMVDRITPKKEYAYLSEDDAKTLRRFECAMTVESIIECCKLAFYTALCLIAYINIIKKKSKSY